MYIRDLNGNEYMLQATSTIEDELNGNVVFEATIESTNTNQLFLDDLSEMWVVVDHDETEHKIVYVKKQGKGDSLQAYIRAIPLFFDDFSRERVYEEYNQSMTANSAFNAIFSNSGYSFILQDSFNAVEWQGFGGGETRIEMFKRALNRYGAEFEIVGKTIHLKKLIGNDTSIQYRHKLNASNIVQETDATTLYTYAKGYANYTDEEGWENAKLIREYTSPLANLLGLRHAPPVKNGKITSQTTLNNQLKELVDNSLKLSVTATIHDLRKQGYPIAQAKNGDRVFLIDERINLDVEVRIVHRRITKNWKGEIIDIQLTFGTPSIVKRQQANVRMAIEQIADLLAGKTKLPQSALDEAILLATKAIQNAQTELQFPDNGGILAIDKNDPNNVVLFNSAGIGVSTDGGNTFRVAMTGQGINADTIIVGTMLADRIKGGTLTLGGPQNGNGKMVILDDDGEVIAELDAEYGGFASLLIGRLQVTEKLEAPGLVEETDRNVTYYVRGTSGDDDNTGTSTSNALYSVKEAINRIPHFVNHDITIQIGSGYSITENVILQGFSGGGSITLDLGSRTFKGYIRILNSDVRIVIQNGEIDRNSGDVYVIDNQTSSYVYIDNITINGNGHDYGIRTWRGGKTYIIDSEIYNVDDCVYVTSISRVYLTSCKGLGNSYGSRAVNGSILHSGSSGPAGNTADYSIGNSSAIIGSYNSDSGSAKPPAPPVVERTETWNSTSSGEWSSRGWNTSNRKTPHQGAFGQWGPYRGFWLFGSGMRNTIRNKTIKRIRVRAERVSGAGNSGNVPVVFRAHQYSSAPSGTPSLSSTSHTVNFKWGERKWFTLPSSFHSLFSGGNYYGIGIQTNTNSHYAVMTGNLTIEVTYDD